MGISTPGVVDPGEAVGEQEAGPHEDPSDQGEDQVPGALLLLRGDPEPDGPLRGHLRSSKFHPAGEAGVVVLGPWGEKEH